MSPNGRPTMSDRSENSAVPLRTEQGNNPNTLRDHIAEILAETLVRLNQPIDLDCRIIADELYTKLGLGLETRFYEDWDGNPQKQIRWATFWKVADPQ